MIEPTPDEFSTYEKVKNYLEREAIFRFPGPLCQTDSLFEKSGGIPVTIGTDRTPMCEWRKYQEGYHEAASLLVDLIDGKLQKDYIVYPILFLYRHYLELMLKTLILEISGTDGKALPPKLGNEHKLTTLWDSLLTLIPPATGQDIAGKLLGEFTLIDPQSISFRYGMKKGFEEASVKEQEISLRNVQALMSKLYNRLNQIIENFQQDRQNYLDQTAMDGS